MEKELKIFFNLLEASPEIIGAKRVKDVRQLRSFYARIKKEWPYAKHKLYSRVIRIIIQLQLVISDKQIIQRLRKIQGECNQLYHRQKYEQLYDIDVGCYDPTSWCGVDYEY